MKKSRWKIPFFGLALMLGVVLGATLLVSYPTVWNPMHRYVMEDKIAEQNVTSEQLEAVFSDAENISGGLWNETPYQEITDDLKFRRLNAKEVSHYEDVRELMNLAKIVTASCLGLALFGFIIVGWRNVLRAGFASFVLLGVIFGTWMLINWHSLFKSLHWIVFQDASWKLPNGSYSLGLFPHEMWQFTGGMIGGIVGIVLVAGFILSRRK